jgi:anti-sigma factor RsiW
MTKRSNLTEQERADLVAYLDGELPAEAAHALETRLSLDPEARAEAEGLRKAWEMLDFLPCSEPSPSFTHRTLSRIRIPTGTSAGVARHRWRTAALAASWLIAVVISGVTGYSVCQRLMSQGPGERELVRDLRLIENMRFYETVEDFDLLRKLDTPDLFGEDSSGD